MPVAWLPAMLVLLLAWPCVAATYYVATDGDDSRSGLSRDQAWATVNHAAAKVQAGDTVLIGQGVYHESVRLRATGDRDRPITFKAIPGEKVVFDGRDRTLGWAFMAAGQAWLEFDSLYFVNYHGLGDLSLPWSDRWPGNGNTGSIVLYQCSHITITRCFSDGRGPGYSGGLVVARDCNNLTIRNNVVIAAMGGGLNILYSPDTRATNNVFLINLIYAVIIQNRQGQAATLAHNIITDNLASKRHVALFYNSQPVDAGSYANCFVLRGSDAARPWNSEQSISQWIDSLASATARPTSDMQVIDDPVFQGQQRLKPSPSADADVFAPEQLLTLQDLDFPDLFATSERIIQKDIGLQREAFADFHFNQR